MAREIIKHALPADERHRIIVGDCDHNHVYDIHVRNRAGGDRLHSVLSFDNGDNDGVTVRAVVAACADRLIAEDVEAYTLIGCPRTHKAHRLLTEALAELVARDTERAGAPEQEVTA